MGARHVRAVVLLLDEAHFKHLGDGRLRVLGLLGLVPGLAQLLLELGNSLDLGLLGEPLSLLHVAKLFHLNLSSPPLAAYLQEGGRVALLGRDRGRAPDDSQDVRINGNVKILILRQLLIADAHLILDEFSEFLADNTVADINDPLDKEENK